MLSNECFYNVDGKLGSKLFDEFSSVDDESSGVEVSEEVFAATRLIKCLIKVISCDVRALKRNTQTTYALVYMACQIYKGINDYLSKVETDSDENSWENYDKYICKIHPLEQLLFRLSKLVKEESGLRIAYSKYCVDSVNQWFESLSEIRDIGSKFCDEFSELVNGIDTQIQIVYRIDDLDLLREICHKIQTHDFGDRDISSNMDVKCIIRTTQFTAGSIPTLAVKKLTAISEVTGTIMTLCIKCTMCLYGVMYIASTTSNKVERDNLMSLRTWRTIDSLLGRLYGHLKVFDESSETDRLKFIEMLEYHLRKFMKELKDELPEKLMNLRKKAGYIGSRFHTQAYLLLNQFRKLEQVYYEDKRNDTAVLDRDQLACAILCAADALDKAIEATRDPEMPVNSAMIDLAQKAFDATDVELKKCLTSFETEDEWAKYVNKMKCKKAVDCDYADRFITELSKALMVDKPKPESEITFELMMYSVSETRFIHSIRTAEANTKLALILWKEIEKDPAMRACPSWHFQRTDGITISETGSDNVLGFNCELSAIQAQDGRRKLYLIPN